MMKTYLALAMCLAAALFTTAQAQASEPKRIATHGEWSAYSFKENGNKVCYMAAQPNSAEGDYTQRGEIFALITHRPDEDTRDVFSYITGYTYKQGSDVTVKVGDNTITLFTQEDTAWAPDAETDQELADAIRSGYEMVVKGKSSRGTLTTDTFSLDGSANAYEEISQACNVPVED
jgi:invasion protein IalB